MPPASEPSSFAAHLPLSRATIDRDHLSRTFGVEALLAEPEARAIVLRSGEALLAGPAEIALLPGTEVPPHALALYLGRAVDDSPGLPAGAPVLAVVLDEDAVEDPGDQRHWGNLRELGARLSDRDAGLFTEALGLANWHRSYGFSPRTGNASIPDAGGWTRRDVETGTEIFPRTDAAVIMGITDHDDRILLGSNAMWKSNRFSVLAGFVEPGESLEAAVIREVHEESGLRVVDPVYLGSQPWPFPASLMVGFRARLAPGESPEPQADGEEILELRWFTRDELTASLGEIGLPGRTSIARAILEDWYGGPIDDGVEW
ncbi:NAD(+) diphosphatase [Pseudolysinimonas kribbensis]|uniref:NAD(+) diphosphatase n=1 Tax=Pseudolysinimonas kribbensis TaxID=433641 RepID=UPI0031D03AE2